MSKTDSKQPERMFAVCPICGGVTRMRYPGNDPENGPARMACWNNHGPCNVCDFVHELDDGGSCIECGAEFSDE